MSTSLFDRIGGIEAIMAAADIFYDKVLEDPLLNRFFSNIDMQTQTKKMVAFMTLAFDGPSEYKGRDLRSSHKHLVAEQGLNDEHFDAVAKHLVATLQELNVPQPLIDEAIGIVASTRDEVLDR
jgi:hemoglobin